MFFCTFFFTRRGGGEGEEARVNTRFSRKIHKFLFVDIIMLFRTGMNEWKISENIYQHKVMMSFFSRLVLFTKNTHLK